MSDKWRVHLFPYGSVSVSRIEAPAPAAFYHVYQPRSKPDDGTRYNTAHALADFLNGLSRSPLLEVQMRLKDEVILQTGYSIAACGPMIDPEGRLCWVQDESVDAQIERGLMIDKLYNDQA